MAEESRIIGMRCFTIAWVAVPLSRLTAGPLVDYVLEPAMAEGGV